MDASENTSPSFKRDRYTVLRVWGLELKVSDPWLFELLTMDAKRALAMDVRDLRSPDRIREARAEAAEAAPDVVLAPRLGRCEAEQKRRHAFHEEVRAIGVELGFEAGADGSWRSPEGDAFLVRCVARPVSVAAACHYVGEIDARRAALGGAGASVVFVVDGERTAEAFEMAIRRQGPSSSMRSVSLATLRGIRDLRVAHGLDRCEASELLAPVANLPAAPWKWLGPTFPATGEPAA
ncbi:MAG TPA: hypothetical protein VGK50_07335 [Coriobacteriia bacterium]|jgi:hypothetical protein